MFTFHASFKQAELFRMTMGVHQHMFIDLPENKINYDAMFAQQAKAKRGARALRAPRGPSEANICFALLRGKLLQNGVLRPRNDYRNSKNHEFWETLK